MTPPILEMRDISKTFPGVRALSNVSLSVYPGEIHALMGENGAGKSTLMKILSGAYRADSGGSIIIDGAPVAIAGPLAAKATGIAIIYQELALAPNLTVAENVLLGREPKRGLFIDRAAMARTCRPVLERLGVSFGPETLVGTLSMAERQLVEIARALVANSRILVMDEPTTSLSSRETERLFALVKQLRSEGLAIIYISHRMAEIDELADRVSVLRDGAYVGTLSRDELSSERLVRMMVGRDLSSFYRKDHRADSTRGPLMLEADNVSDGHRVKNCSLRLHGGEVVGLAGLVGAGRTELARLLFAADAKKSGSIRIAGKPVECKTPQDAINAGLVYLTEDRKGLGVFLDMSVRDNINLAVISRDSKGPGVLDRAKARARSEDSVARLGIRVPHDGVNIGALSGGNQQKALLARLLETRPKVLILDEPTRGVDVGAKAEIYRLIDNLAREGAAILVISSELPELLGICDRLLVMRNGLIDGALGGEGQLPMTQENVMAIATGAARPGAA